VSGNTIALVVGRLLEVRLEAGFRSVQDVEAWRRSLQREVGKVPMSTRIVTVADWRSCPVMQEEAAALFLDGLRKHNPRAQCSAALASQKSPIAMLQFLRLIRDSNNPDRKLFYEQEPMIEWLKPVLSAEELVRLKAFLAERPASS
jgi:hypothetical protein